MEYLLLVIVLFFTIPLVIESFIKKSKQKPFFDNSDISQKEIKDFWDQIKNDLTKNNK